MILMPNDDKPWHRPNAAETLSFESGGVGEFTAEVSYARRTGCSEGPALHFLEWYFADAATIGDAIRRSWDD